MHKAQKRRTGPKDRLPELEWYYELVNQLIDKRIQLGLTQVQVAEAMGTVTSYLWEIEVFNRVTSMKKLSHYAEALGVSIVTILVNEEK
jgi:transcriptional regulator with XRE-family HTH domain